MRSVARVQMKTGTNQKHARALNYRTILNIIRVHGPIARAEIARRTSLTRQTVSNITRALLERDLIVEGGRVSEGRGAPSIALALNPDGAFSVGLDLDEEHLTGVLVDQTGAVRQHLLTEMDRPSPTEAARLMERLALSLLDAQNVDRERLWGVGIGIPGPVDIRASDDTMVTVRPSLSLGWRRPVPIGDLVSERLHVPVYVENNATAAALGERWYGDGRHYESFFYFFLGSGLGGGLILNGHPFEGHSGNAGEIGYMPTWGPARPEAGFRQNHHGIHFNLSRLYASLAADGYRPLHPRDLLKPFLDMNPTMLEWLSVGARLLSHLILTIEYVLDPKAVFLGGRLPMPIIEHFRSAIASMLPRMRIDEKTFVPELLCSTAGDDAAALGVATLPMYTAFAPVPSLLRAPATGKPGTPAFPATGFHLEY